MVIARPGQWNPDEVKYNVAFAAGYALHEMMSLEEKTQIAGVVSICDGSNFGFKHFRNTSLEDLKFSAILGQVKEHNNFPIGIVSSNSGLGSLQDHFTLWFRQIHCINFPRMAKVMFEMTKPMLGERIQNMIVFHDSNESLHEHVDKRILPEEYGGPMGKFDNEECVKQVHKIMDYLLETEKYAFG